MPSEAPATEPEAEATKRRRTTLEDVTRLESEIEELKDKLMRQHGELAKCREQLRLEIGDKYDIEDIAERMRS